MNVIFLLKIQLFTSIYMTGIIWLIQVIHYPLFKFINEENWPAYHSKHLQLTTIVIAGPMIIELVSLALIFYMVPAYLTNYLMITMLFLILLVWVTTFCFSVPFHNQLAIKYEERPLQKLIQSNWVRTISWSLKSIILLYLLNLNLKP